MGQRPATQIFLPNKWVFPGGRLDEADHEIAKTWKNNNAIANRLLPFALAGIRELYEETGLALAKTGLADAPALSRPPSPWQPFRARNLIPGTSTLRPLARAITPPGRVRRYDTWFFVAPRTASFQTDHLGDGELLHLSWLSLAQAERCDLPNITRLVLSDLSEALSKGLQPIDEVPFYRHVEGEFVREMTAIN